jgi:hypothetical protein
MEEELKYKVSPDADRNPLVGNKDYNLHLSPEFAAKEYWSVIAYDNETCLMIHTDQLWPSVYRSSKGLEVNQDGSVEVYFDPVIPIGKDNNWKDHFWQRLAYDSSFSWPNGDLV